MASFRVESACMVGAWDEVQLLVDRPNATQDAPLVKARLLLAMQTRNTENIAASLAIARCVFGAPITASGVNGYRRSYDAILDLHLTHELEVIYQAMSSLSTSQSRRRNELLRVSALLSSRLDATLPTFRTREPVLSMRRTAFGLLYVPLLFPIWLQLIPFKSAGQNQRLAQEIGNSWVASAKIARKAGQWQTAYSAMLQAQQSQAPFSFVESAKLLKATGEPLRALQELENSMKLHGLLEDHDVLDLTVADEAKMMRAKVIHITWSVTTPNLLIHRLNSYEHVGWLNRSDLR